MIRAKSILIKLNMLQLSDQELLAKAVSDLQLDDISCPNCGTQGCCRLINPYKRMMITIQDGYRVEEEIAIPRIQCLSCESTPTHAFLPDILIPHSSYTLRFILFVLRAYLNRKGSVRILCEDWQIAVSTLYEWIHLFTDHYNLWCKVLDRVTWVCKRALDRISDIPAFPSAFFNTFRFSFLQRPGTTPSPPVTDSG